MGATNEMDDQQNDQQKQENFSELWARLIDSVNRLLLFGALVVFYFVITPILFKIQQSTAKTAQGIERQDATLEAIRERMESQQWQQVKPLVEKQNKRP